jgi:hypothetical protein
VLNKINVIQKLQLFEDWLLGASWDVRFKICGCQ